MILRYFYFLLLFILTSSCTSIGYISEQAMGWSKIQFTAVKNEKLLDDPKIDEEIKRKILLVGEYKKFFYHFFSKPQTGIYSKTKLLSNKAVSYLVIASQSTKIEPVEFHFPIVGNFPYLGFYEESSAEEFAKKLKYEKNLVTFIRPVYAYSTLGYFEDRILSSFFHYDDIELAELIFHELFHTILFIKDEVDLNENMANLFARELLFEYFKDRPELKVYLEIEEKKMRLNQRVVELIQILQDEFSKLGEFLNDQSANLLTERFVREIFLPDLRTKCRHYGLSDKNCDIKEDWNQASFAAFMTYEKDQDLFRELMQKNNLDLRQFLSWINLEYERFKDQDSIEHFTDFLKLKVSHAPLASD